jgi:glyoxylase-like metal-dependent hydrolase (beta-lactamase superfamily II)
LNYFGCSRFVGLMYAILLLVLGVSFKAIATPTTYQPEAVAVVSGIYAIVGPLDQRSEANAGLNANYGFIETPTGVILIDSGASHFAAALIEQAVKKVTDKPIKWVLNTGSQDHRWLGNGYFNDRGAEIHALAPTVNTQREYAAQQIESLKRFVGDQMTGTEPVFAQTMHDAPLTSLIIDGVFLEWFSTHAHYPGDAMIYVPQASVMFTGDLVYVDRLLSILPQSNVRQAALAFETLIEKSPAIVIPGHGRVTDLAQAQIETGDYYQFLIENVGAAAQDMSPMTETLDKFATPDVFMHLQNFEELHRANMNRVFLDFEANP